MAEDDSGPPKPKDWSLYEKPYYTIAEVVKYWCELPDDYAMALDRHRRPLPDPKYPRVKVRTDLLVYAIETYELPHEAAPDKKHNYRIGEGIQPRDQVIRQDALKHWFCGHRSPERPPFLFWREDAAPPHLDRRVDQPPAELSLELPEGLREGLTAQVAEIQQRNKPEPQPKEASPFAGADLAPARDTQTPADNGVTVTLPFMTKALEKLFQIMRDNWEGYDTHRKPKQVHIQREIDKAMGWKPLGDPSKEPSRNAKALAILIKPDEEKQDEQGDPESGPEVVTP